ncbi:hypothetical protein SCFA_670005 [anaerobic digester metagenome]|uniref:Uncharacterized protein n=1 Tax=anaerobic digester metagenome TaxID=1263854 RepID=A0A485MDB9_9ZZZZ
MNRSYYRELFIYIKWVTATKMDTKSSLSRILVEAATRSGLPDLSKYIYRAPGAFSPMTP